MKKTIKTITLGTMLLLTLTNFSVSIEDSDQKAQALINEMEAKNGGWDKLVAKHDVEFVYIYEDKAKGLDISTERYIFDGETSWGDYIKHEVNVFPGVEGHATQLLVDGQPKASLDGELVEDQEVLGFTEFLRRANFFWFSMMYKLNDPGVVATHIGQEIVDGVEYDKVSISYDSQKMNKSKHDTFILYFNPETKLVDQFYFSLDILGVKDPVLQMKLEYELIDGVYVATRRVGIYPDANGQYAVGGVYTSMKVSFNNGFQADDLSL